MKTEQNRFRPVFHSLREQKAILGLVCVLATCFMGTLTIRDRFLTDPVSHEHAQKEKLRFVIPINTAPMGELLLLPGIGETLAERIVEQRETAPLESADDLELIRGIGEKKRAAIAPFVDFTLPQCDIGH